MMIVELFLINLLICDIAGELNFLLIVVDDLRPALGCYGDNNAYTPNIDRMAQNSVLFNRAYAQQSLCAPSRNSFLTSRRPDTLQLYDFYSYWRNTVGNFTTLPQHLKNHGYKTKSVGKIFHPGISSNRSDDSPYSWSEKPFHPYTNRFKNSAVCNRANKTSLSKNLVCPVSLDRMPGKTLPDLETLNAAKMFIKNNINDKSPFFLAVGFQKPHIPLKYPREYLKYHPLSKINVPDPYKWQKNVSDVAYNPWSDLRKRDDVEALLLHFPWERIPEDFAKTIIQSYYAAVTYIDDLVGKLMDQLRSSVLDKNTVVILTSDHGWSLGEHAEWAKYSNFEVALRVPLIVSIPRTGPQVEITNVGRSGFLCPNPKKINKSKAKRQTIRRLVESSVESIEPVTESGYRATLFKHKVPERSNIRIEQIVELVDLFPTIAELAGFPIPICPDVKSNDDKAHLLSPNTCSEGISLLPLINAVLEDKTLSWKSAAISQYPRPGLEPTYHPSSDKPRLRDISIMGYSLRSRKFRYTAWVKFFRPTRKPDWQSIVAEELYDHDVDPDELKNIATNSEFLDVKSELRIMLKGGWRKSLPVLTEI